MKFILFLFKYVSLFDLALNFISLGLFVMLADRIGQKIQTFGLVYVVFIIPGLIGLTGLSSLFLLLSTRLSILLGCLLLIPSIIHFKFILLVSFD